MRHRGFLPLAFALLAIPQILSAQDAIPVDAPTLDQHVAHRVAPEYPPNARAAAIEGTVVVEVQVGTTGRVESSNVVSGPQELRQAATDCLKQWTFDPFLQDGLPVAATGPVFIEFALSKDDANVPKGEPVPKSKDEPAVKKDEPVARKAEPPATDDKIVGEYSAAADECRKELSAGSDYKSAFITCKKAAEIADRFGPDRRFTEKRSAFVSAAWASMYGGFMKAAFTYAGKAVDVVKLGNDDDAGTNAAYGVKGIVEGKLGFLPDADRDLTVAEDSERKVIAALGADAPDNIASVKQSLIQELQFHAQILQALNRADDAQKKLDEAATYD